MTAPAETLAMATLNGKPYTLTVAAYITSGLPYFSIIGYPDRNLGDTRERIKTAVTGTGRQWPQCRVTVSITPCTVRRDHPHSTDLAVAIAICDAIDGQAGRHANTISAGAIDDTGHIGRIGDIGIMAAHATIRSHTTIITGHTDAKTLRRLGIPAHGADHLAQALALRPDNEDDE